MGIEQSACVFALCTATLAAGTVSAQSCDKFAGQLISNAVAPAITGLGCEGLDRAGLDEPDHQLQSVCYTSDGATSHLEIVAILRCKTSDEAIFQASISDTVTAKARVRGSDCQLLDVDVQASGDIGNIFIQAFDVSGIALTKLQQALDKLCQ